MIKKITVKEPKINYKEIYRYCSGTDSKEIEEIVNECLNELNGKLTFNVCYDILNLDDDFFKSLKNSETLKIALKNCNKALIFAATVGTYIDRLIIKYSKISPVKALILQAIGAERIEGLCNDFCENINSELNALYGEKLKTRVSPGYGDIPINKQTDFIAFLDCERKLGLTVSDKFIMSPTKSVTAIAGIEKINQALKIKASKSEKQHNKCENCSKTDCAFRNVSK